MKFIKWLMGFSFLLTLLSPAFSNDINNLKLYYSTDFAKPGDFDIVKELYQKSELKTAINSVNIGFSARSAWIVFKVPSNPQEQIITIQNAFLDSVKVYFYKGENLIAVKEAGDEYNFYKRDLNNNFINFIIPRGTKICYMHVYTSGPLQVPVKILALADYVNFVQSYSGIHFMFFGFVILIVITNTLLYVWLKNSLYIYYILSVLSVGFITAVDFGYSFQYIWPNHPNLNKYNLLVYLLSFFFILFTEKLLNLKKRSRKIYILFNVFYGLFALTTILSFILPYEIAIEFIYSLLVSVPILSFIAGVWLYRKIKSATINLFLTGWITFFISIMIYSLTIGGTLEFNIFTNNILQIGTCIEIILFNLAVLSKINLFKRKNELLLAQQNKILEEKVISRTKELKEQSNEIKKKNIQLQYQQEHLEKLVEERTQKLILINKELLDKNTRLEQFANVTAHNLRGPVATLLGLCEIYNITQPEDPVNAYILKSVKETTLKIDSILHDLSFLLDLNKDLNSLIETVNLETLLQDIKILLQSEIEKTNTTIMADFSAFNTLPTIPAYINNIFYNLISNGIKFRKKDVNPVIEIYTRLQNNIPMILFKDNGIGINLKKHGDKLFQPYKRFELSTQGKGLGLHITRTQIEAMGGHIEIESEPGKGTTFKVHFPITNEKHTTTNPENKEVME